MLADVNGPSNLREGTGSVKPQKSVELTKGLRQTFHSPIKPFNVLKTRSQTQDPLQVSMAKQRRRHVQTFWRYKQVMKSEHMDRLTMCEREQKIYPEDNSKRVRKQGGQRTRIAISYVTNKKHTSSDT